MAVRQIKHTPCHSIVLLHHEIQTRTDPVTKKVADVPTPVLFCPTCNRNVGMDELTPGGAICVLFTQK